VKIFYKIMFLKGFLYKISRMKISHSGCEHEKNLKTLPLVRRNWVNLGWGSTVVVSG